MSVGEWLTGWRAIGECRNFLCCVIWAASGEIRRRGTWVDGGGLPARGKGGILLSRQGKTYQECWNLVVTSLRKASWSNQMSGDCHASAVEIFCWHQHLDLLVLASLSRIGRLLQGSFCQHSSE